MLLLLLNDENNAVVGEGIELILARDRDAAASVAPVDMSRHNMLAQDRMSTESMPH